jgi:predicted O-methyltransferase YrrM
MMQRGAFPSRSKDSYGNIPIFILCRDRLEPLKELVQFLERAGHERIYLVDNDSAYPPLLEYLSASPHEVVHVGKNAGSLALWEAGILRDLGINTRFVLTDPDVIPIPDCPLDAIAYLGEVLDRYPDRLKAGLGLRIDDLPESYKYKNEVLAWESQFWEHALGPRLYDAAVATTLALYRATESSDFSPAIRTGYPYLLRHTPWYVDEDSIASDEAFYRGRAEGDRVNHWGRDKLPAALAQSIAVRNRERQTPLEQGLDYVSTPQLDELLASTAWYGEPEPVDEARNTPFAAPGWRSWNDMSPEVEVCEFVADLVRMLRPRLVVETGVGQGFVTRRMRAELAEADQRLLCFESDPVWRQMLARLGFFDGGQTVLASAETPDITELGSCDLCVFDSAGEHRSGEIKRWWSAARNGAVLFVHDAGNRHDPDSHHGRIGALLRELRIPGVFLKNPRGSFLGIKAAPSAEEASARLRIVESELEVLRNSRTFRYSAPLRRGYATMRRSFGSPE